MASGQINTPGERNTNKANLMSDDSSSGPPLPVNSPFRGARRSLGASVSRFESGASHKRRARSERARQIREVARAGARNKTRKRGEARDREARRRGRSAAATIDARRVTNDAQRGIPRKNSGPTASGAAAARADFKLARCVLFNQHYTGDAWRIASRSQSRRLDRKTAAHPTT